MKKEITVISGCDSGIGRAVAELLVSKGETVVVSYLRDNPFISCNNCFSYKMDFMVKSDITKFIKNVNALCSKDYSIKCLFNNAGTATGGPIEDLDMSVYMDVFRINFFAHIEIIQGFIPILKKSRGLIINNGSMAGRVAPPFMSPYASSKYAMEGFTDSLRREMKPFGIRTVLLEPASVATPIWNNAKEVDRSFVSDVYRESVNEFMETFVESGNYGLSPDVAAQRIYNIMQKKNPAPRYIISKKWLLSYLQTMAPDRLMDYIAQKVCSVNY